MGWHGLTYLGLAHYIVSGDFNFSLLMFMHLFKLHLGVYNLSRKGSHHQAKLLMILSCCCYC